MRRLDARGPGCRRVAVDAEGAMLGPDCVLVRRTPSGYRSIGRDEAAAIGSVLADGHKGEPDALFERCCRIAQALNEGQLALAQIAGLRIPLFELDARQLKELAAAAPLIKANFNPDEPRDAHGRWTDAGSGASTAAPAATAIGATAAAEAESSIFGALGRAALASLADFAAGFAAPAAFLGVLFLPTSRSTVSKGTLPGRPDLAYRYDRDTGILDIYRQGGGGRQWLDSGHIGADGRFHDAAGRIIGRNLGQTIAIDPDALPAPLGHARAEVGARSANNRGQPKLCPDESPENINGRSERSLAYQEQISGLPRGWEVKLNGVRFDGCREEDGTMLEAKGPGYATFLDGRGGWKEWFSRLQAIQIQIGDQSRAARPRRVEWHFAEKPVADYFREYVREEKIENVIMFYTPAR
jgi:hypothetical protein